MFHSELGAIDKEAAVEFAAQLVDQHWRLVIEFEANEDPDALFDSCRDYLDQLAAYKKFSLDVTF